VYLVSAVEGTTKMTLHARRALRASAVLAGVAALGGAFSGSALADESGSATHSADSKAGGYLTSDDAHSGGYFGDENGGYFDSSDYQDYFGRDGSKDGVGHGSLSGVGGDMVPFSLPSRGPSTTVPVKNKNDDDSPFGGFGGHHDHHGAGETYDYDLYSPTESYDKNKCSDRGSSRGSSLLGSVGGYNGDSSDDCKLDSGDYHPKRTGFEGDYNPNKAYQGYDGYLGGGDRKYANGNS
jgi:hypothetical protein